MCVTMDYEMVVIPTLHIGAEREVPSGLGHYYATLPLCCYHVAIMLPLCLCVIELRP